MPELSWGCEGADGVAITAGNSGLDSVPIGTGGSAVYDASVFLFGTSSAKLQTGTGTQAEPTWSAQWGTQTAGYARFYLRLGAYPGSNGIRICMGFCSGGTVGFGFDINTTGTLTTKNATNGTWGTTAGGIPLNQWVRIEMDVPAFSATAASPTLRVYLSPHSATADYTVAGTNQNVGASSTIFRLPLRNASLGPVWIDGVDVSSTAQPGPIPISAIRRLLVRSRARFRASLW